MAWLARDKWRRHVEAQAREARHAALMHNSWFTAGGHGRLATRSCSCLTAPRDWAVKRQWPVHLFSARGHRLLAQRARERSDRVGCGAYRVLVRVAPLA